MGFHRQEIFCSGCALGVIAVLLAFAWVVGVAYSPAQAGKDTPEDTPASPSIQDRLAPPPMGTPPTQVDRGHFVYYQVCMACHGDHGQGLTDEWRAQFGPQDMNCWQSKCHSFNHPPHGFQLVKTVPALIGTGTLSRFDNAQQLHDYIVKTMPWWKPGYLRADEFWQVTAFLMSEHGVLPKNVVLDEGIATVYLLRPASPLPGDYRPATLMLASVLVLAAAVILIQQKLLH
jgi:mono/diheme cytochrome c family protein